MQTSHAERVVTAKSVAQTETMQTVVQAKIILGFFREIRNRALVLPQMVLMAIQIHNKNYSVT